MNFNVRKEIYATVIKALEIINNPTANTKTLTADLIIFGGDIITLEDENPEAVAVKNGLILDMGTKAAMDVYIDQGVTELLDLQSNVLLPGLIASHEHPGITSFLNAGVDLSGFTYSTSAQVYAALTAAVQAAAPGEWVYGVGLDFILVPDLVTPTVQILDQIAPNNPVFLVVQSLHDGYANSMAFDLLGITKDTPDPAPGSTYGKDQFGELTGFIKEQAAMTPFLKEYLSDNLFRINYDSARAELMDNGFTSVVIMGDFETNLTLHSKQKIIMEERTLREWFVLRSDLTEIAAPSIIKDSTNTDIMFKIIGIKFWYDGSPYAGSMYMIDPYLDTPLTQSLDIAPGSRGEPVVDMAEFKRDTSLYHNLGFTINFHSQGDNAGLDVTNIISQYIDNDNRHCIQHALYFPKNPFPTLKTSGMTVNFHINHLYYYGNALVNDLIGPAKTDSMLAVKSAFDADLRPTLHADSPMFPPEPFSLMRTAVTRKTKEGNIININESITPLQALQCVTINAAWQAKMDDKLGSIKRGKIADFTIVDQNPLTINPDNLDTIAIVDTMVEGQLVSTLRNLPSVVETRV